MRFPSIMSINSSAVASCRRVMSALLILYSPSMAFTVSRSSSDCDTYKQHYTSYLTTVHNIATGYRWQLLCHLPGINKALLHYQVTLLTARFISQVYFVQVGTKYWSLQLRTQISIYNFDLNVPYTHSLSGSPQSSFTTSTHGPLWMCLNRPIQLTSNVTGS